MGKENDILESFKELKNSSPYRVPEGYFDTLQDRIEATIKHDSLSNRAKIFQFVKPWMSLAAGFLFIIIIYVTFIPEKTDIQIATNSTELYNDSFENLDIMAAQLSEYDLAAYLSENDIDNAYGEPIIENDISDLTAEDIEELILF